MQQDQNPQEQQPQADAPPQWFQQYTQQLGGVLQQQNQQIARLAQTVAQGSQPAPVKPTIPAPPQSEIRERILGTIVNEPERFVSEVVGFAEQRAEAKMAEREMRLRQEMEYQRFNERFWGEFFSANPNCRCSRGEVGAAFQQTDPNADYSARANYARDVVRQKIQAAQEAAKYAAEAQNQSRRAMAGAPVVDRVRRCRAMSILTWTRPSALRRRWPSVRAGDRACVARTFATTPSTTKSGTR